MKTLTKLETSSKIYMPGTLSELIEVAEKMYAASRKLVNDSVNAKNMSNLTREILEKSNNENELAVRVLKAIKR